MWLKPWLKLLLKGSCSLLFTSELLQQPELMAASAMALRCLAISALFAGCWSYVKHVKCGDTLGPSCHNAFDHATCSTGGACCHDDFHAWCCPEHYTCNGHHHGIGDCYSPQDDHGDACTCTQTEYEMIDMIPDGPVTVDSSWESDLSACCSPEDASCGVTQMQAKSNSQSVTWSDAAQVGSSMKYNVEVGPAFKLGFGFHAQETFTSGQTTTTSDGTPIQAKCTCTSAKCDESGSIYFLDYKTNLVSLSQPVKIRAKMCGETKTVKGMVKVHQYNGEFKCSIEKMKNWAQCQAKEGGR